jgi:hypothetical protein
MVIIIKRRKTAGLFLMPYYTGIKVMQDTVWPVLIGQETIL